MGMKILFCFYPLFVRYNHGIALLSALCKERGIETDLYILDSEERFAEYLKKDNSAYVSFSCVTVHDYKKCLPFIHEAKRLGKTVLLGGVYVRGNRIIDATADYICRGEGETLPDFILNGDDRLFKEKMICKDINSLPLPDYELFKNIPYDRKIPMITTEKVLPYHTSRGCLYSCTFCEVHGQPKQVRIRRKVHEDLEHIVFTYKPDYIFFSDELMPYYDKAWRESWGSFKFPFIAYIRADISADILHWLYDRGMVGCLFGVESGDEKHRNNGLNKNLLDTDIFRTVNILKELGIYYQASFIIDTPKETFIMKARTYKMAREIGGFTYITPYENLFKEATWQ